MTQPVPIPVRQRSNTFSYAEDQVHAAPKDQTTPPTTTVTSPRSVSASWWSSILSSPRTAQTPPSMHSQASSVSSESSGVRTPEDDASSSRIRFANDPKMPSQGEDKYSELQAFREAGKRRASWAPSSNQKPGSPTFFTWMQPQSPGSAADQNAGLLRRMSLGGRAQPASEVKPASQDNLKPTDGERSPRGLGRSASQGRRPSPMGERMLKGVYNQQF